MASVTPLKRAHGYAWRVQARDENRRMRQETFYGDDPRAVEKAARAFARMVDRIGITEASRIRDARSKRGPQAPTVAEWLTTYLDPASGMLKVSDGVRDDYRNIARTWITPRLGDLPIDAVDVTDVEQWVAWMEAQPGSRGRPHPATKTIKSRHALLSQALRAAEKKGHRTGNPAVGIAVARRRKEPMAILTPSELAVVLHFLTPARRPLIMWLAGTGMRWSEATALTWGDIDRDTTPPMVHITKAWEAPVNGSTPKLGPPKTDASIRTISVPPELLAALGKPGPGDQLIFRSTTSGPVRGGSAYDAWAGAIDRANDAALCKKAGLTPIGKRPRRHDLRRSHASWLIGAGRPLPYIHARLGHEKITTTVDTYGHLLPDAQHGDADAVGFAMSALFPTTADVAQIEA